MIEYFKSVNNKYTYDNDKYLKNETPLMDEDGDSINMCNIIQTKHFIYIFQTPSSLPFLS